MKSKLRAKSSTGNNEIDKCVYKNIMFDACWHLAFSRRSNNSDTMHKRCKRKSFVSGTKDTGR